MTELDESGLARIEDVDPRQVWANEAHDFTPWLAQHLDLLAEALGLEEITLVDVERRVGDFSLDILAEIQGAAVAIENQLERSDHNHLGQLLGYAAGLSAEYVIWISPEFREEHRRTIDWLNELTGDDVWFFAVELRVVRVGVSPPAPLFDVVAGPNEWTNLVKDMGSSEPSELNEQRRQFYAASFAAIADLVKGFRTPKAQAYSWNAFRSGPFGNFALVFDNQGRFRVEAYLDSGDKEINKQLFDELSERADELQVGVGAPLTWERLDNRRASRISVYADAPDLDDEQAVEAAVAWTAQRSKELLDVLEGPLRRRAQELKAGPAEV